MDQEYIYPETNNVICEAVGCSAKASKEIRIKVGHLGFIKLLVCNSCRCKFVDCDLQ